MPNFSSFTPEKPHEFLSDERVLQDIRKLVILALGIEDANTYPDRVDEIFSMVCIKLLKSRTFTPNNPTVWGFIKKVVESQKNEYLKTIIQQRNREVSLVHDRGNTSQYANRRRSPKSDPMKTDKLDRDEAVKLADHFLVNSEQLNGIHTREVSAILQETINALPQNQRVSMLGHMAGLTSSEIALQARLSPEIITMGISRARNKIKNALEEKGYKIR